MKRLLFILLLMVPLATSAQSALYRKYASHPDLTVAQVSGFRLNDTVKVDVVIIVADDNNAWQKLKTIFDIRTHQGVTSWIGEIDSPQKRTRYSGQPVWRAMAVHDQHTIAFYRINNNTQYTALLDFQTKKMKNQN